ncbi:GNAT family N-acetyltransferase [Erysipelothrix sp. HDW6A]|uniref:GNAT family N-acetyltransferase n=1 Tax=Erysipelothrix sp. HDW6A TaxID=2714928 RepID=UPI001408D1D3|nr:GNAT family N-acetyltransferase [Erysipelothrix sp. HDW6A]QIK56401.1 GNAT family N-acetyltransferase [Erysipelothrix sp. HDW6A]
MAAYDIKDELELRKLNVEDIDQYNELLRYVFQVTQSDITSSGYEDEAEIIKEKRPILSKADVYGWFKDEDLVSQLAIYPCTINVHGVMMPMGGVTGVGTYPEYAGMGLVSGLIKKALETMRETGQYISYLYPYSIPLYRNKGWEIISDVMEYTIKDTQLPSTVEVLGHVERLNVDDPDVLTLYNDFVVKTHGAMLRDTLAWEEYWRWEDEAERIAAVYYDEQGEARGLCFYWLNNEVFYIKEMIYLNEDARRGLWNFISAHFSMIESVKGKNYSGEAIAFGFDDSDIVETIQPYYMARIVDVDKFLESYPFTNRKGYLSLDIKDNAAPWNNGIHTIRFDDSKVEITNDISDHLVSMDIRTLTTLLMGYRSVSQLVRAGRIIGTKDSLKLLNSYAINEQAYFSDYF